MGKYKISGVPICRDGKLVGIITNRDMRFMTGSDFAQPISCCYDARKPCYRPCRHNS